MAHAATCTAFSEMTRVATGPYADVAIAIRAISAPVLIFDDETGRQVDFDLRGTDAEITQRLAGSTGDAPKRPGRPKLGVVAREVTLLPRHWDWLSTQPGGASVALRKLVEAARGGAAERVRIAQAAADRFMLAMAGNLPHYEEAARALYAGQRQAFQVHTEGWPVDVRTHARKLAADAFPIET